MASSMWFCKTWPLNYPVCFPALFTRKFNRLAISDACLRSHSTSVQIDETEYSEAAEYPPCFDPSLLGRRRMKRQVWYDEIQSLPTVEEKLLQMCKDHPTSIHICTPFLKSYTSLPLTLHSTRTHLIEEMPDHYNHVNVDSLVDYIKPTVLKAIRNIFSDMALRPHFLTKEGSLTADKKRHQIRGQLMTAHIFRLVASLLSSSLSHLRNCQQRPVPIGIAVSGVRKCKKILAHRTNLINAQKVDYNPRSETFWWAGGFPPPLVVQNRRKNVKYGAVVSVNAPVDFCFQYIGKPYMQIRNILPLPPFLSREDRLCSANQVPKYYYGPGTAGLPYKVRYATSVPGFWPADPCGFGTMSIHTREDAIWLAQQYGEDHLSTILHNCGVLSSFAWLVALAYYKGFSPYQELTYPFMTQTVITNGQFWSFYAYQLNTICLSQDLSNDSVQNVCWTTNEMKLFDTVEHEEVKGFNDSVLKQLVKFFVNSPQELEGVNLTPYLTSVEHPDETWANINKSWKDKYANKPGLLQQKETYLWEKIYKIKFNAKLE